VAGLVVPDYIVLGPDGTVEHYQIGAKEAMVIPAPSGGVRQVPVPRMLRQMPALSTEQACEIGGIVRKLEGQFGTPLDIEGGIAGGTVHLFQARPITTCAAPV
jgi:pyruvate,water dikinase